MGATGVVVHIGSHRGRGFAEVRTQVIRGLTCVLEGAPPTIALLLENNAGTGGCIGADFDELGAIIADLGHPSNVGVCLDTAHIFAMGYDIRTQDGLERVLAALEESVGLERLALIHANDSKTPLGARRDRHANIGEGEIGLVGFETLFSRPELRGLPFVLETPQLDRRVHDLAALRAAYERAVARNS
jgi:deoxyribonuclease-4